MARNPLDLSAAVITMRAWSVFLHSSGYRLVGYDLAEGTGRISSPLVSVDLSNMTARTESGRLYVLQDENALNRDGKETLGLWRARFGVADGEISEVDIEDVAAELSITGWGSGNVFADLGLPDPDVMLVKAELAIAIKEVIDTLGLTMKEAAAATALTEEQVAGIVSLRGRTKGLSIERMDMALKALLALNNGRKP